jgi:hypothetical protein
MTVFNASGYSAAIYHIDMGGFLCDMGSYPVLASAVPAIADIWSE